MCASAYAATGVELDVDDACADVDRAQLKRLLSIEQRRAADTDVRHARVSVSCDAELATLRVERRDDTAAPRTRSFALADVRGEIGARVLALAAIELLEPEPAPEPVVVQPPPRPVQPPPPPPPPPPHPLPSVRLSAIGSAQSFGGDRALFGGGLSVDYLRLGRLGLRLGFDVAMAERRYDLGRAQVQLTTLHAQAGYLALHDTWLARAFVGYRLGAGRISGVPAPGIDVPSGTVAGAWGGPLLSGGLGLRRGVWIAELGAETGLVSFPIQGHVEGHDDVGLDHYWLSANLSLGALL